MRSVCTKRHWPVVSVTLAALLAAAACTATPSLPSVMSGERVITTAALARPDNALDAYVLDVGQGACIFIDCPDNARPLLIDCGTNNNSERTTIQSSAAWIKERAKVLGSIAVAISHPHTDHYSGLTGIDRGGIESVSVGGSAEKYPASVVTWAGGSGAIRAFDVAEASFEDTTLDCGTAQVDVLTATVTDGADDNADSLVISISYGELGLVLPGDAEDATEASALHAIETMRRLPKARTVVISSHHGAQENSNSEDWLKKWKPYALVFSASLDQSHKHPRCAVIQRAEPYTASASGRSRIGCGDEGERTSRQTLDRMLSTYDNGHIRIRLGADRITIACQIRSPACSTTLPAAERPVSDGPNS